jgi:hypothetical protein
LCIVGVFILSIESAHARCQIHVVLHSQSCSLQNTDGGNISSRALSTCGMACCCIWIQTGFVW